MFYFFICKIFYMRLLFVIDLLGIGGKERRCLQLIKGLNDIGEKDIHLILLDNVIDYKEVYNLKVNLYVLDRKSRYDISVLFKLVNYLIRIKPDIVLSWSIMSSFWLNLIHVFCKFKFVSAYVANNIKPPLFSIGNFTRIMSFLESKFIIGNSEVGLRTYQIPKRKAVLIYNGFDYSRLENLVDVEQVKLSMKIKTPFIVTMIGRMTIAKDFQTFLNSAKKILKDRNDTTFLAVGDGYLIENYKNQISNNELEYIRFVGLKSNVEEIIQASNICVLCSPSEGISNFIVESMALGKPVIATKTGGTPEIVYDNYNGYLIDEKDVDSLSEKLIVLLNREDLRMEFGENGKKLIMSKFALEKATKQYIELFTSILNK
jgi:glycosyltransferase involved in cell wall biosynthesis